MEKKLRSTFFFFLIIPLFLILFKGFIENKIIDLIVVPFLSEAKPILITDYIWIVIALGLIIFSVVNYIRGYAVSTNLFIFILFFAAIYSFYRFYEPKFTFHSLTFHSQVYYFDLILLVFLLSTLLKFTPSLKRKANKDIHNEAFIIDQPVNSSSDDRLNRKTSAYELAQRILVTPNEKAFAVGINGTWGAGKTSYLNLIKEGLQSDVILIDFNPWRSLDSTSLIKDFFNTLSGSLKKYSTDFYEIAKLYSEHLSNVDKGIYKILNFSFLANDEPLNEYYRRLNEIIKKLNRKIIIFIDDLDRLDKEEIYEVLKLIRNTADFNYVSYIVAYDKKYVNQSLKKLIEDYELTFLEKIFQVERHLPFSDKVYLKDILYEYLLKAFPREEDVLNEKLLGRNDFSERVSLKTINNVRDAKRFLNSFIYGYSKIRGEVSFVDFFNLEVLKLKYQLIYEDLYRNSYFYLSHYQDTQDNHVYFKEDTAKQPIKEYLEKNGMQLGLTVASIPEVIDLFGIIFKKDYFKHNNNPQSISLSKNFYKYFIHTLNKVDLSENEFKLSRHLPYDEFTEKLKEWIGEGKRWEIIQRIKRINSPQEVEDKDDFEKIIKSMFFIANCLEDKKFGFPFNGYPDEYIYEKIYESNKKEITKKFYAGDVEQYKKFLKSIFENASFPFYHERSLLEYINEHQQIVISKEELKKTQLGYFKKAIEQNKIDYNNYEIYGIYHSNFRMGNQEEINKIFKEYLDKGFLKYFLKHIITLCDNSTKEDDPEDYTFYLGQIVLKIFKNYEEFDEYLLNKNGDPVIEEFKKFYEAYKEKGNVSINFKFEHIPIKI